MSATTLATAARILYRLIERYGIAPDAVFLDCGLDPLKLRDSRARYPVDAVRAAWRVADGQIRAPCWGLQAGEVWSPTDFHALGYAFLASRTLRAALHRLRRYNAVVVQDARVAIAETDSALTISYVAGDPTQDIPVIQDSRDSILLRMCRDAYGQDLRLLEVAFAHPSRPCAYEEFFGCPVRYEAPLDYVTFPREVVDRYLPAQNLDLARMNDEYLKSFVRSLNDTSVTERVRRAVLNDLPAGKPAAADVARALAVSPRTLQRKLQQEGTTFEDVIEGLRKDLAQHYVQSGEYDLLELVYLMGFSTLPAFSRAYKSWTGRSPSADLPDV
ncbi:MAG: AraC family transcriptional regulator ligand-binding domain-containing protein [Chromatiaceae bacterium]